MDRRVFLSSGTALVLAQGCVRPSADQTEYRQRIKEAGTEEERLRIVQEMFEEQNRKAAESVAENFPFELLAVPGNEALAALDRIRAEKKDSPVILGSDEGLVRTADGLSMPPLPRARNSGEQAVLKRARELVHPRDLEIEMNRVWRGRRPSPPLGEWPNEADQPQPLGMFRDNQTGELSKRLYLARIPTTDWTEIPAYLKFGGWNACPSPEYHIAAFRSWRDRYGAELISLAGDILELRVSRRPQSREEALSLARELYIYDNDLVDQAYQSLAPLAAALMASDCWQFWWD